MPFPIKEVSAAEFPPLLREIPQPPKSLNYRGALPPHHLTLLSVVGSRKYTSYGKQVVDELIGGLKGYPIGIVSGLALGIDSLAHEAALKNNLYTLAIPGGGLGDDVIYPATHKRLAFRILEAGGGLLSEYAPDFRATEWSFPQRNRLVAGISRATLLIEAAEKSGTLITARMTTDYNRELLVVPGSIFSKTSAGTHQFLKLGATPVTSAKDILDVLGIEEKGAVAASRLPLLSPNEANVISLLTEPRHRDELIRLLDMNVSEASQLIMMMELSGHISAHDNVYRITLP
jgi:DNA processing protein